MNYSVNLVICDTASFRSNVTLFLNESAMHTQIACSVKSFFIIFSAFHVNPITLNMNYCIILKEENHKYVYNQYTSPLGSALEDNCMLCL